MGSTFRTSRLLVVQPPAVSNVGLVFRPAAECCLLPCMSVKHAQEHRLLMGQKDEFHLEAFVARAMSQLKAYTLRRFG